MPIVTVQQFPRSVAQKRELARRITEAFEEVYGNSAESVQVFFNEVDGEHWARGGRLGCDREDGPR
ncbi:tautomerase family protein [Halomonas saccharevitans]|nr:4-oxalocrotonate tautomerase family protein [Halomonas saccharevitans]SFT97451.1 4-oxalocrotonate tautomerase [Halomonas saccharevitans]